MKAAIEERNTAAQWLVAEYVDGRPVQSLVVEERMEQPDSQYGMTRDQADRYCQIWADVYGVKGPIVLSQNRPDFEAARRIYEKCGAVFGVDLDELGAEEKLRRSIRELLPSDRSV